ncbi:MAG: DHH family phosphoesterase, partial [Candidatus Aenigmarchaeota archaeon]|nr:DHH family phosphoesterase [Candidatus Aenigmarchaeota archaeon]
KELSEGLGKGGGHPQAAGASVPKKYSEEFLERLRSYLSGS